MVMQKKSKVKEDNTLAIITHILGIFSYLLGPLLIFLLTKDKKVKKHAKNALNWQISLAIYAGILFVLSLFAIIGPKAIPNLIIIFPFSIGFSALGILNIVLCIIASIKAYEGVLWRYPLSIGFMERFGEKAIKEIKKEFKK